MHVAVRRHAPAIEPIPWCSTRRTRRGLPGRFRPRAAARTRCGGPRIPTSRGCIAARRGSARRCSRRMFPRAYIDPNRSLADIDPELLADACGQGRSRRRARPSRASGSSGGSRGTASRCMRASSSVAEVERANRRAATGRTTRRSRPSSTQRHRAFGAVWHLDCHSMPAVGDANADDPGRARADFVLGDRDGTTCDPAFTRDRRCGAARTSATPSRSTIRTRVSRSCASTAGRGQPAQPADRGQPPPLHGRGDARAQLPATRSSRPISSGSLVALAAFVRRERGIALPNDARPPPLRG